MRPFLFVLALACACLVAEFALRLIGYPALGAARRYDMGRWGLHDLREPYSRYWSVEAGNKVFARNNIGLTGIDVDTSAGSKFVFVLGSSYVEAFQVEPALMSTSVLQKRLQSSFDRVSVLNLGFSAYDPYQLYFTSVFYEMSYKPHRVILFLEEVRYPAIRTYQPPLHFHIGESFGKENKRWWLQQFMIFLRNHSVFINLVRAGFGPAEGPDPEAKKDIPGQRPEHTQGVDEFLAKPLDAFQERYGGRFICVSIDPDSAQNRLLGEFCHDRKIHFLSDGTINTPRNRIAGKGHLNETGNRLLGELFNKAYVQFNQEP